MPRVNLVIACYGGSRRTYDEAYEKDRAYYLKLQADSFNRFRDSSIHQITLVSTGGDREEYYEFLRSFQQPVVIERENAGMSYGSWDAAWRAYPDFDYYIFMEDDYLFACDDYAKKMIEVFESFPNCGYLCQLAWGFQIVYPAISNGMASRESLIKMGGIPGTQVYSSDVTQYYGGVETEGQYGWGVACQNVHLRVYDMGSKYKAPFIQNHNEFLCWYPEAPGYLIVPAQIYNKVLENPDYVSQYETTDEDWQKFKHYYLVHRNIFLSEEHRKSLEIVAAPFRVKTREDFARIVDIYERSLR